SGRTRSTSKAETPRPIRIAIREQRLVALGSARAARGLSRRQPRDGLALRRGPRAAGPKAGGGLEIPAAHRFGSRSLDRHRRDCRFSDRAARAAVRGPTAARRAPPWLS